MAQTATARRPWETLREKIQREDLAGLQAYVAELPLSELTRAICRLETSDQTHLLSLLSPENAAELVTEIPDAEVTEIFEQLSAEHAASIVNELPSDEQANLIAELGEAEAEAILAEMPSAQAKSLRELAAYTPDTAGGLMITEFLAFPAEMKVRDLVRTMERNWENYSDYNVQYVYIVDQQGKLIGVLQLRDLLVTSPERTLQEVMLADPIAFQANDQLDKLLQYFNDYAFFGFPVTSAAGKLIGLVQREDVQQALTDRMGADQLKLQGIVQGEEFRSMPTLLRSRRRLSWLSINIVLNVLAASIIAMYEETLRAVIALAVFLPIISDMSGCSGSQSVAVSLRELALGLVRPGEVLYVWLKEISVGAFNGLFLGIAVGLIAWTWKGSVLLGVVVGLALALNTMVAVSVGGIVPLLLRRLGLDPAIAAGPILTTITDMFGFFLVLSLASALLV